MEQKRKNKKLWAAAAVVLVLGGLAAGYGILHRAPPLERNLTKVLETAFALPHAAADALEEAVMADPYDPDAVQKASGDYNAWQKEALAPYFTDRGYESVQSDLGLICYALSGTGWRAEAREIRFSPYSQESTRFDLLLAYNDGSGEKTLALWGRAQGDASGKISWLQWDGKSIMAVTDLANEAARTA